MPSWLSHHNNQSQRGFTLLEVMLYLALFGMIIGGIIAAGYAITQGAARSDAAMGIQEEQIFVTAKLNWLLDQGVAEIPGLNESSDRLVVRNKDASISTVSIEGHRLVIQHDSNEPLSLTSTDDYADNLVVTRSADHKLTI